MSHLVSLCSLCVFASFSICSSICSHFVFTWFSLCSHCVLTWSHCVLTLFSLGYHLVLTWFSLWSQLLSLCSHLVSLRLHFRSIWEGYENDGGGGVEAGQKAGRKQAIIESAQSHTVRQGGGQLSFCL